MYVNGYGWVRLKGETLYKGVNGYLDIGNRQVEEYINLFTNNYSPWQLKIDSVKREKEKIFMSLDMRGGVLRGSLGSIDNTVTGTGMLFTEEIDENIFAIAKISTEVFPVATNPDKLTFGLREIGGNAEIGYTGRGWTIRADTDWQGWFELEFWFHDYN